MCCFLPASQRISEFQWYEGTADAVYQNIDIIESHAPEYMVILAGDHIYKMDYELILQQHCETGADVTIVEYLKTPPSRAELVRLYDRAGMTPRQGLRMAEDGAKAVKHGDAEAILDAMMIDPLLIERPLVETDKGVRLGRPIARLHEIL